MRALTLFITSELLIGCQAADAPVERPMAPKVPSVVSTTQAPNVPELPATTIEGIDFNAYSQDLAAIVGLEIGESRIDSIDKIRLHMAPTRGDQVVNLTSSTFERDDGSVLVFARVNMPDDSIHSEEVYAVFSGAGGDQKFNQKLADFGMRMKCHRGETSTEWTQELCP